MCAGGDRGARHGEVAMGGEVRHHHAGRHPAWRLLGAGRAVHVDVVVERDGAVERDRARGGA
jgi:hypothetical protein